MKYIKYKILGYNEIYNSENGETEQQECFVEVSGLPATEENIEKAKREAYNGEITIEEVEDDAENI